MLTINLFDYAFPHTTYMSHITPKYVKQYIRNQLNWDGITIFTNNEINMVHAVTSRYKVAVITEPPEIEPYAYHRLLELQDKFDIVFTLVDNFPSPKHIHLMPGPPGTFIPTSLWGPHNKPRMVSMVCSPNQKTHGHRFRRSVAAHVQARGGVDLYGKEYTPLPKKEGALVDYAFTIVVTNSQAPGYISDHVFDPLLTYTIPIFWGCINIDKHMDVRGFILFNTTEELDAHLSSLSMELYEQMLPYAKANYEKVSQLACTDDVLALHLIKTFGV